MKRLTTEEFIEKARKVHGKDKYDYSEVEYITAHIKVKIKCNKCGKVFEQEPNSHLHKRGCPYCYGSFLMKQEEFIVRAQKIHQDDYSYNKVHYINARTKVEIICKKCGKSFWQSPYEHLYGHKCPYCCGKQKTTEFFIHQAQEIHGNSFNYNNTNYISSATKVEIICKKCGKSFWQTPNKHLRGQGCPYCNVSKGEIQIKQILDKMNIKYIFQKRFKDCRDKKILRFDFYLVDYNICIEYQGKQHYEEGLHYYINICKNKDKGILKFRLNQLHDQIKRDYCKANNIQLIEIKYNENIEEKLKLLLLKIS